MWWRDSDGNFSSSFRESLRFDFPSTPWAASSSSYSAESGDGSSLQRPGRQQEDGCSYTKLVRSRCFLHHNGDGKPVKKCEKTEQLLRNCFGRPQEIVESKSESTEEELPDGWTMEGLDEEKGMVPFSHENFPGAPSSPWKLFQGTDPFSRGLSDGVEGFMQAAEEMMNDALNQLGFYKRDEASDGTHPYVLRKKYPNGRNRGEDGSPLAPESSTPHKNVEIMDSKSFDEV
eukprot:c22615_g1_i1 orf=196-888(-)